MTILVGDTKMKKTTIAIASGKGGTGKTTFATNLAYVYGKPLTLLDCDVEAPNVHLFLNPKWDISLEATVLTPVVDESKCISCGKCKSHCRFGAILILNKKVLILSELCHSCGACERICPTGALVEKPRVVGTIDKGTKDHIQVMQGKLYVGEARSSALIEQLRDSENHSELTIIDAPPGTSCSTISAVNGVDYLVLVTEPTPLGLNDLSLSLEMAKALGLRTGVVINKADLGSAPLKEFCEYKGVPILGEIKFSKELAKAYSQGLLITQVDQEYEKQFRMILESILEELRK